MAAGGNTNTATAFRILPSGIAMAYGNLLVDDTTTAATGKATFETGLDAVTHCTGGFRNNIPLDTADDCCGGLEFQLSSTAGSVDVIIYDKNAVIYNGTDIGDITIDWIAFGSLSTAESKQTTVITDS